MFSVIVSYQILSVAHIEPKGNMQQTSQHVCSNGNGRYFLGLFLDNFGAKEIVSNTFIMGPGGYRKVEEKYGNHSDKFAGRNSATPQSDDQTTKLFND